MIGASAPGDQDEENETISGDAPSIEARQLPCNVFVIGPQAELAQAGAAQRPALVAKARVARRGT